GGSSITLSGPTNIFCSGRADISGGSFSAGSFYLVHFFVSGAGPVTVSGGSIFKGFIYAPSAPATVSSATLIGGLFANQVTISGSAHVTRASDDVAPVVVITSPAEGAIVSDPAHTAVSGKVSESETPVTLQVNGTSVAVAADGTFNTTVNLTGVSPATITAKATDAAGNTGTATVHVTTVPPPVLSLTSPPPDSLLNTRVVNLSGGAGNATAVTVDSRAATIAAGVWSLANFDLGADGAHTLTIVGTSAGGSTTIKPVLTNDT